MGRGLRFYNLVWLMGATILLGCSQGSLSDRDARLEQLRLQADAKRRELQQVSGDYSGQSTQTNGTTHEILFNLAIKDTPTVVEGIPEPVLMPDLTGSFKFYIGPVGGPEYFVVAIEKAGYNVNQGLVEIVASNPEYHDFLISLKRTEPELKGDWSAPGVALSGTMSLKRIQAGG